MGPHPRDSGVTKGWFLWSIEITLLKQHPTPSLAPHGHDQHNTVNYIQVFSPRSSPLTSDGCEPEACEFRKNHVQYVGGNLPKCCHPLTCMGTFRPLLPSFLPVSTLAPLLCLLFLKGPCHHKKLPFLVASYSILPDTIPYLCFLSCPQESQALVTQSDAQSYAG